MSRTYLMGNDAMVWYDKSVMDDWKMQTPIPCFSTYRWRQYKSNWRILHVDGFEPGYGSRTIQFCWSTGVHPGRFADKIPSENV